MSKKPKYESLIEIDSNRLKGIISTTEGIRYKDLAALIGVTPEHFSRSLANRRIYESWLETICERLDVSKQYITGESDSPDRYEAGLMDEVDARYHLARFAYSRGIDKDHYDLHRIYDLTDQELSFVWNAISAVVFEHSDVIFENAVRIASLEAENAELRQILQSLTDQKIKEVVVETVNELRRDGRLTSESGFSYREISERLKKYYIDKCEDPELLEALDRISNDQYYEILTLYYEKGYTIEAIAETFGVEISTIVRNKKRISMKLYNLLK